MLNTYFHTYMYMCVCVYIYIVNSRILGEISTKLGTGIAYNPEKNTIGIRHHLVPFKCTPITQNGWGGKLWYIRNITKYE